MKDFTQRALKLAKARGAKYADVRVVEDKSENLGVKNGVVNTLTTAESSGFGVRVYYDGGWGFASSSEISLKELEEAADRAVSIARASALVKQEKDYGLAPVEPASGSWESTVNVDPFEVKLEDKLDILFEADRVMRQNPKVRVASSQMRFWREKTTFASTEGAYYQQEITESGGGIDATAVAPGEMQRRSYPSSFGGDVAQLGYQFVDEMDLVSQAERVASEAAQLLEAKQCPSGAKDLILDGSQLALQVHESCGHPIELDRVLGQEASYAGTSFLTPEKLGDYRYGSDIVNINADATIPHGLGSFKWDDEGVSGQKTPIIEKGIFKNYLTSRDTAPQVGQERSNGTMRADGPNRVPMVRMTNVNLEPGDWTLDEIIKDTKDGIYMVTNKSWSIDDKRLNFQFGTEVAWEVKDGSLGDMVKNPTYTGITPEFWGNCDAIASGTEWRLWGLANCGKGQPGQVAHVGHGTSPSRFRDVKVGVGKW